MGEENEAMFPDHSDRARLIIPSVAAALEAADLDLTRARSKLYAQVHSARNLDPGETYKVNLEQTSFRIFHNGELALSLSLQVIGTWLATKGTWVWSFANPSIAPQAYRDLEFAVRSRTELAELANCVKFLATSDFCENLAQYIAVKAGWVGAFCHQEGDTEIYLALKLAPQGDGGEPPAPRWCSFCGRSLQQAPRMISVTADDMVCNKCIELMIDCREVSRRETSERPQWRDTARMPPCFFCGGRTERIFTSYSSVCLKCVDTAETVLKEAAPR